MKHQGLGWPKTYFVWGWVCGGLSVTALWHLTIANYAAAFFLALGAGLAFTMARWSKRPLFSED
jgi:hypothetical protein